MQNLDKYTNEQLSVYEQELKLEFEKIKQEKLKRKLIKNYKEKTLEEIQNLQNFRPNDAARFLGVGLSTIWLYIKQGKLEVKKLSSKVTVIERTELERFIKAEQ